MISDKKALDCIQTLIDFCDEQMYCENCIFREMGGDHWNCLIDVRHDMQFVLNDATGHYYAKRKRGGWIT